VSLPSAIGTMPHASDTAAPPLLPPQLRVTSYGFFVAPKTGLNVCEPAPNVLVRGDAGWLERLLINLVDNAIAFTPAQGRITIRVTEADRVARVEVEDTGIGVPEDVLPLIFDRFYQADPSRSSRGGGVGLGLSLARWIAQRHDATITVQSAPDRGSTFTVRLPLAVQA